ncbi:MAG: PHP domain-containing protein [Gammaproteobacteria bacterium]
MAHSLIADLHTHTLYSDGSLSPAAVCALAHEQGVDLLAITDHDTLDAYADVGLSGGPSPELVVGLELSALWTKRPVHIVGLGVDPQHEGLRAGIVAQRAARELRATRIAKRLEKRGIPNALEGARRHAGQGILGRPHFAAHLVECGAVRDMAQAFHQFLGHGKPGDVSTPWPQMATVIDWVREAGGVAVLAHPAKYKLTRTKLNELVAAFKTAGGAAMEVISGTQQYAQTQTLANLCEEAGLLASSGSDFHHPDQRWAQIGKGLRLPSRLTPVWTHWRS